MIWPADSATLRPQPSVSASETTERGMADAVRSVAVGMAPDGNLAIGMADAVTVLWSEFHRFDAADPHWPDRDRFVISPGYGAPLLYALLHLTGHDGMECAALDRHRQLGSAASGHPDSTLHPAVEATTGPLGQGLGMAVGMALGERLMAARFGKSLVDHRTTVVATLGDLMEGISHEAASLAGHLRLEKLTVLLEDDTASVDCCSALAGPDDALRRFAALGWATRTVDAHDPAAIASALSLSARARKPTLIACRTVIGFAAATAGGPAACPRAPLGRGEAEAARDALDWRHPPFTVPDALMAQWHGAGAARHPGAAGLAEAPGEPSRCGRSSSASSPGGCRRGWHEAAWPR